MKRVILSGCALLLLLIVAQPLAAQRPGGGGPAGPITNPVAALLEHADSLDLTGPQRAALEAVRDSLTSANEPHVRELQAARAGGGGAGGMQALRPVMQRLRANNDQFVGRALGHLQPAQRQVAERILARLTPRRPGDGAP